MDNPISVLLVDDNSAFLEILQHFLESAYAEEVDVVGVALGGKEGLIRAQELQPDVVLLDLLMSDLHGLDVIPRLRETLPEVYVIALTLLDIDVYREAALEAGAHGFIGKGKLASDLLPALRRVGDAKAPQGTPTDGEKAGELPLQQEDAVSTS